MGSKVFTQYNLGRTPHNAEPPKPTGTLNLTLKSEVDPSGNVAFFFAKKEYEGGPNDPTTRLNFDIDHDVTEVTIDLANGMNWCWSNSYSAITTKKQLQDLYCDLQYSEDGKNYDVYDDADKTKRFKFIRFLAHKNVDLSRGHGDRHAFCLNINLLLQDSRYLAITLDPDIRNPPPQN